MAAANFDGRATTLSEIAAAYQERPAEVVAAQVGPVPTIAIDPRSRCVWGNAAACMQFIYGLGFRVP